MKHIAKYIVLFVLVTLTISCEKAKFLDRAPYTQTTPENYFKDEGQFRLALVGAYEAMNCNSMGGYSVAGGTYNIGLMQMMSAPSDEVLTGQNAADNYGAYTDMIKCSFTESTTGLRRFWDAFYGGINRCNSVIENSSKLNSAVVQSYVAEARFLRGFYYWYLAQFFGGVPIVSYQGDGSEPRSNLEAVYNYIEQDLEYAYNHLPATRDGGALGYASANKYTAAAYLGRIYNYLAACKRSGTGAELVKTQPLNDFAWVDADSMSVKACKYLEDVALNSPYKLTDDFRNLFRETTKDAQHEECLLMAENYLSGSENNFPPTLSFGFAPSCTADKEKGSTSTVWGSYIIPTPKIFGWFYNKDPRRDWFYTGQGNGSVSSGTLIEEKVDGIVYVKPFIRGTADTNPNVDSPEQTFLPFINGTYTACGKYRFVQAGQISTHNDSQHGMSIPLMRLADVYLMYAEAAYYSKHDLSTARTYFEKVINRAAGRDATLTAELMQVYYDSKVPSSDDEFRDVLLKMREIELCFEGSRKYDLMRFNLLDKTINDFVNVPIGKSGDTDRYSYNAYIREYDGRLIGFGASYIVSCSNTIRDNWRSYKIWCPLSKLQIEANSNLQQNAGW